ncbi:hypothetical protein BofuT4_P029210.1 [Botrytis cinerea T4]|uniref:Uncharacterized protein n=1 Tax=Botryotinia fuckeliana (strain T4) TaxID=999810 RepID=G2Y8W9_BOTF4|nr:hypothetical protein BofuT4_P029210.1 [Botrytis cinerea T4]
MLQKIMGVRVAKVFVEIEIRSVNTAIIEKTVPST